MTVEINQKIYSAAKNPDLIRDDWSNELLTDKTWEEIKTFSQRTESKCELMLPT